VREVPSGTIDPDDLPPKAAATPYDPGPSEPHWYGWQVLVGDATSAALIAAGIAVNSDAGTGVAVAGIGGAFLAGPVIHAAHGRWSVAGASLAVRLGLAIAGGAVGAAAFPPCRVSSSPLVGPITQTACGIAEGGYMALGASAGLLVASAIDATAFSWERPRAESPPGAASGIRFEPQASWIRRPSGGSDFTVGLVGGF
jgi:hypothetical protein